MPAAKPTQAQISRAIRGAMDAGVEVGGVETRPDGTVIVLAKNQIAPTNAPREGRDCDSLFGQTQ